MCLQFKLILHEIALAIFIFAFGSPGHGQTRDTIAGVNTCITLFCREQLLYFDQELIII